MSVLAFSVSNLVSPFVIAVCRRKSTRLTSVIGGLVVTLGCLFASFATELEQIFVSFGLMVGKNLDTGLQRSGFNNQLTSDSFKPR